MQLCDKMVRLELMPDDLIQEAEGEVDSTTEESPVKKKPKVNQKPAKKAKSDLKSSVLAKIEAAKMRASEIFANTPSQPTVSEPSDSDSGSDTSSNEIARLREQVRALKKKVNSTSATPQQPFSMCEC